MRPHEDDTPDPALHILANPELATAIAVESVPAILGRLERAKAALWTRLLTAASRRPDAQGARSQDELLTVPEVAKRLRFTRAYLYEAVRHGDLVAVRKGKYVRIRQADLDAWLDGPSAMGLDRHREPPDSVGFKARRSAQPVSRRSHVPSRREETAKTRGAGSVGTLAATSQGTDS